MNARILDSVIGWGRKYPTKAFLIVSGFWILLIYAHVLWAPFSHYDDLTMVVQNRTISSIAESLHSFHTAVSFTSDFRGAGESFYRPLFWLSLAVDKALWGLNPIMFHLTGVVLHWLNGFLLFLVLQSLDIRAVFSAATSLIWLALPVNSEAVAWISARPYCLSTFFILAAVLMLARYLSCGEGWLLLAYFTCTFCALLSVKGGAKPGHCGGVKVVQ